MFFFLLKGYAVGSESSDIRIHIHLELTMKTILTKHCGYLNPLAVIQAEAILFTADKINRDKILNGYTLGLKFFDTCENTKSNPFNLVSFHGLVVIGPSTSELSMFTSNFLSIFSLSTISFGASANIFYENRQEFKEFFSTAPPDSLGSIVYRDLALEFDWKYTSMLESNNEDGISLASDVHSKLQNENFCVVRNHIENDASQQTYHQQMKKIIDEPKIKTIFLFLTIKACTNFFLASTNFPERERLKEKQFVLGTNCGSGINPPHEVRRLFEGMIIVQAEDPQPKEFTKYFNALLPTSNTRNEYFFQYYWQFIHNCISTNLTNLDGCNKKDQYIHRFVPVRPVMDALYAATEGVKHGLDLYSLFHSNRTDIIGRTRENLDTFMPNVNFRLFKKKFNYNRKKQFLSNYDVLRFHERHPEKFMKIAFWEVENWKKNISALTIIRNVSVPNSECSLPCEEGEIKEYYASGKCCWKCKKCPITSIIMDNKCQGCTLGYKANLKQTICTKLPVITMSPTFNLSIWVITISTVEVIGIFLIAYVYLKHFSSHIIKSSSRELALFSLFGSLLMLLTPVIFVLEPTKMACYTQKILVGLSLTCCYSPLVLKTNRVFRIFASSNKFKLRRLVLVSMRSQFLLISAMIGIQLLIGTFWVLTDKPVIITNYPPQQDIAVRQCNIRGTGAFLNLTFPIALMVASTFWAFKTRHLPETFSEIKSIGVTMYITMFLATLAFIFIFILNGINQSVFTEIYVVCFTLQAIVFVNLIGQFAMKIKSLYKQDNIEQVQEKTNTEISIVMSNRFNSPTVSPKVERRTSAAIHNKAYDTYF